MCNTSHNNQHIEVTQISNDRWIDKEFGIHKYMKYYTSIRKIKPCSRLPLEC